MKPLLLLLAKKVRSWSFSIFYDQKPHAKNTGSWCCTIENFIHHCVSFHFITLSIIDSNDAKLTNLFSRVIYFIVFIAHIKHFFYIYWEINNKIISIMRWQFHVQTFSFVCFGFFDRYNKMLRRKKFITKRNHQRKRIISNIKKDNAMVRRVKRFLGKNDAWK